MSLTVKFQFDALQDVRIKPLGLPGKVLSRTVRASGIIEYQCVWWADGKRCDEWLMDHELEAL